MHTSSIILSSELSVTAMVCSDHRHCRCHAFVTISMYPNIKPTNCAKTVTCNKDHVLLGCSIYQSKQPPHHQTRKDNQTLPPSIEQEKSISKKSLKVIVLAFNMPSTRANYARWGKCQFMVSVLPPKPQSVR